MRLGSSYVYDSLNQLTRENNEAAGKTWVWTYDNGGNILSKTEYAYTTGELGEALSTVSYTYGDSSWGDLLTAYNGVPITHDEIGNPLNDGTWTYAWNGRQLASMTDGTTTWSYKYNADGLRTEKTNGTKTYKYVYSGDKLVQMSVGDDVLKFTYDGSTPATVTYNGSTYYYVTNLQGDVVAIVDQSGNPIASYCYDAWGNLLSEEPAANSIGNLNPLRYRGYVYDQECNLYYLQSRYYDPSIGRFLNADDVKYLGVGNDFTSYNLFAYCGNNPIAGHDPTGNWDWGGVLVGLGIIAATVAIVATCGIATVAGAVVASAAVTTGAITTYAAATDSTMVVDVSYSNQVLPDHYVKGGGAIVVDFENDNMNFYPHVGGGKGYSSGFSYAVGVVDNYEKPDDYAKDFVDINVGSYLGVDHCWNPFEKHESATQATSVTFSSGISYGVGYDYYFGPTQILAW